MNRQTYTQPVHFVSLCFVLLFIVSQHFVFCFTKDGLVLYCIYFFIFIFISNLLSLFRMFCIFISDFCFFIAHFNCFVLTHLRFCVIFSACIFFLYHLVSPFITLYRLLSPCIAFYHLVSLCIILSLIV